MLAALRPGSLLLTAVLAVAMLGACGGTGEPDGAARADPLRPGLLAGMAVNLRQGDESFRRRNAAMARRSGVDFIRDSFRWEAIEPRPGRWSWREPDAVMRAAGRERLRVLPVLHRTPRWASGNGLTAYDAMPRRPDDYARFVAAVVRRYGPRGAFWRAHPELDAALAPDWYELYNEPYGLSERDGGPEVAEYARTASAGIAAGRAAAPASRFLIAGALIADPLDGEDVPWLEALLEAVPELGEQLDAVAVHAYSGDESPRRVRDADGRLLQYGRVAAVHDVLARRGRGDTPVWITETGWSTCPRAEECVSEATQARHLRTAFDLAERSWPWIGAVSVYGLESYGAAPDEKEGFFGLVQTGRPKPAWYGLQRITGAPRSHPLPRP